MKNKKFPSPLVAVIGCGHWGKNLVRNFAELGALAAVCDRNVIKAQELATHYDVKAGSEEDILRDPQIDAVVIATQAPSHEPIAEAALKAGKHVYLEKPMALSLKASKHLCALAKTHDRILMIGHILNYHPAFIALKNHLKELGSLKHIYANRLGLGRFRSHESVLWDLASHDISLILSLTQTMPLSIHATGQAYLTSGKPASALLTLTFPLGLTAHVHVSWASPFKEQKLVVIGDKGIAVFDDRKPWAEKLHVSTHCFTEEKGEIHANEAYRETYISFPKSEPLQNECHHFLTCLQTKEQPLTPGEEGVKVTEVLEKAEESLKHSLSKSIN